MKKIKQIFNKIVEALATPFYGLVSASWFPQLPNNKVIKLEIFYAWMSIGGFFAAYGIARDHVNNVDFSTQSTVLASIFLLGWILRVGTVFGYNASKAVQEKFWRTQLMRFLDPKHQLQFDNYPNSSELLKEYKERWIDKYGVTVEWTRANAPYWQKVQIALLIGCVALGITLGNLF
jgi:hypothetical protein